MLCVTTFICLGALLVYRLFPSRRREWLAARLDFKYDLAFGWLIGALALLGLLYLFHPTFLDHVESTVAALGRLALANESVYPTPDRYPYHGVLYGPALATLQGSMASLGLPVIAGSKLPGVAAFLLALIILFKVVKGRLGRGYLLLLLPYGWMLFWNRAEPFLLLLVCVGIWLGDRYRDSRALPIWLGLMAGTASSLKMHGALYLVATALVRKLRRCEIPILLIPNGGRPFSLKSFYTEMPLFEEDVRRAFETSYQRLATGAHYSSYGCAKQSVSMGVGLAVAE